jgi:hypothetical protein
MSPPFSTACHICNTCILGTHNAEQVIPEEILRGRFTPAEFSLLVNGVTELKVDDWRAHTRILGFDEGAPQIEWFWKLVSDLSREERSLLLQFWTGCTATPQVCTSHCVCIALATPEFNTRLVFSSRTHTCILTSYLLLLATPMPDR